MIFLHDKVYGFKGYFKTLDDAKSKYPNTIIKSLRDCVKPTHYECFYYYETNSLKHNKLKLAIKRYNLLKKEAIESRCTTTFDRDTQKLKKYIHVGIRKYPEALI